MDNSTKLLFQQLEQTNKVNPYTIYELQELLEENSSDISEIDRLCFSIATNLLDNYPLIELQQNDRKLFWYDYLKLQIYIFLNIQLHLI